MNDYASLRQKNNGMFPAVVALALAVILSASLLFSRLEVFSATEPRHNIPLTRSGGTTAVFADGQPRSAGLVPGRPLVLAATPFLTQNWFQTSDENTVWQGQTQIEIFRISYENGAGQVTVNSANGEKLLAPGTENKYAFQLENTGKENVEYTMSMEAYFSHDRYPIPVQVKVSDHEGNYHAGSADEWVDVLELNNVSTSGKLKPGYVMPYTLQWQWPFELDDAYDTMLGNLAVEEDITLTIVIHTTASYTPDEGGGIPQTGDTSDLLLYSVMLVVSLAGMLFLLIGRSKREDAHE